MRTSQLRAAIERAARGSGAELRFVTDEHEWPDTPTSHDAEVREYTGDTRRVSTVLREVEVAAVHMAALGAEVLAAAPRLRLAACARGGAVNVNLDAATARGILVCNAPGRNARAVAEFTVALIIDLAKGISRGHRDLAGGGRWRSDLYRYDAVGDDLAALTVGLLGLGHIGRLLVPLLNAFGARVLACDPYLEAEAFAAVGAERCDLPDLLARADVLSLHARHRGPRPLVGRRGTGADAPRLLPGPDRPRPAAGLRRPGAGPCPRPPGRGGARRVPGGAAARRGIRCWSCPTSFSPRTSPGPRAAAPAPGSAWRRRASPPTCAESRPRTASTIRRAPQPESGPPGWSGPQAAAARRAARPPRQLMSVRSIGSTTSVASFDNLRSCSR